MQRKISNTDEISIDKYLSAGSAGAILELFMPAVSIAVFKPSARTEGTGLQSPCFGQSNFNPISLPNQK